MSVKTDRNLHNIDPDVGARDRRTDNPFGIQGFDHLALPTLDIRLMERFLVEVLGGEPYYYAGFDDVDREMGRVEHIFVRVGSTLAQCAVPGDGTMIVRKDDPNVSPHWGFRVSAADLDRNKERISALGIPVVGPYRHRGVDLTSIYFASPEQHKLEICTWDPYPEARSQLMGAPGVGHLDWPSLAHNWGS